MAPSVVIDDVVMRRDNPRVARFWEVAVRRLASVHSSLDSVVRSAPHNLLGRRLRSAAALVARRGIADEAHGGEER